MPYILKKGQGMKNLLQKCAAIVFLFCFFQSSLSLIAANVKSVKPFLTSVKIAEKGVKSFKKGKLKRSEKYFLKALKYYENNYRALGFLGEINLKKKEFKKAVFYFEKSLNAFPIYRKDMVALLSLRIKRLENIKKRKEMLEESSNPESMRITDYMCGSEGDIYRKREERRKAAEGKIKVERLNEKIVRLKKRLEKVKNMQYSDKFRIGYVIALLETKNFDKAIENCNILIKKGFSPKKPYSLLIQAYLGKGDCKSAIKVKKEAETRGVELGLKVKTLLNEKCR